ncbi:hypothetical protein IW261DRAFT_1509143 [Armillaria novae-zelandiae]|uniref:Uncharacterized protein n=1 Tax=Armillaria novae-zelandiae TaxID=153914 RepID=A0AA39NUR6_9AGAR|nr:hypothetical protein IW261DRAFT_1509143 [Armillaria novae-zelandiae]
MASDLALPSLTHSFSRQLDYPHQQHHPSHHSHIPPPPPRAMAIPPPPIPQTPIQQSASSSSIPISSLRHPHPNPNPHKKQRLSPPSVSGPGMHSRSSSGSGSGGGGGAGQGGFYPPPSTQYHHAPFYSGGSGGGGGGGGGGSGGSFSTPAQFAGERRYASYPLSASMSRGGTEIFGLFDDHGRPGSSCPTQGRVDGAWLDFLSTSNGGPGGSRPSTSWERDTGAGGDEGGVVEKEEG